MARLSGCDISEHNNPLPSLSGYDFVIVRSSYGIDGKDRRFAENVAAVKAAGKLLGFYHYSYPNYNTGVAGAQGEADNMISVVSSYIGQCILVLDWEEPGYLNNPTWVSAFLSRIKERTGVTPFIYCGVEVTTNSGFADIAKTYPLWIASWGISESGLQAQLGNWSTWTLWQYQGDPFDLDYFNGSAADWATRCSGKAPEPLKWISSNAYLTEDETYHNLRCLWQFFQPKGWSLNAVSAMAANMYHETLINPGVWQNLTPWPSNPDLGFGLVAWSPYRRITDWLTAHGYEIGDGDGECSKIQEELEHPEIELTWWGAPQYDMTFEQFHVSTEDPGYLSQVFLKKYEHGPDGLEFPDMPDRARKFYLFLSGGIVFEPRLDTTGMQGSKYWYSDGNPFYAAGFGLPNCTCYAYGRWWEITGERPTDLSLQNANTWWDVGIANGIPHGQTPRLGAIICFWYSDADGGGHVAVVEQINEDGSIVTSNSAYGGTYFYLQTLYPPDYKAANGWPSFGYVQGFLYLPENYIPPFIPPPEPPKPKRKSMPLMFYLKHFNG